MKWIEMIRLIGKNIDEWQTIHRLIAPGRILAQEKALLDAGIYVNPRYGNDLCLHLWWETDQPQIRGSRVGLSMTEALKYYGLVEHAVWIEQNITKVSM